MTAIRYVPAWDKGFRNLGAHWIREDVRPSGRDDTLNSLMQVDHVILVDENGMVRDDVRGVHAPEVDCGTDFDGQILPVHERGMVDYLERQGWSPASGWSSQQGTKGDEVIMHVSEFVGGNLAEHIVSTPGYWVVCSVEVEDPDTGERDYENPAGWVVMHRNFT